MDSEILYTHLAPSEVPFWNKVKIKIEETFSPISTKKTWKRTSQKRVSFWDHLNLYLGLFGAFYIGDFFSSKTHFFEKKIDIFEAFGHFYYDFDQSNFLLQSYVSFYNYLEQKQNFKKIENTEFYGKLVENLLKNKGGVAISGKSYRKFKFLPNSQKNCLHRLSPARFFLLYTLTQFLQMTRQF